MTTNVRAGEAVSFRFALLVAVLAAVGFGLAAFSESRKSDHNRAWAQKRLQELRVCDDAQRAAHEWICADLQQQHANLAEAWADSRSATARARLYTWLAFGIPVLAFFAFYALRWVFLGRLRPIWPLHRAA
jgi:hypothetical protein